MSNEKKFTRGHFEIHLGTVALSETPFTAMCEINEDDLDSGTFGEGSPQANAELICEAFNVATETGMTPLQLQSRIKELENHCDTLADECAAMQLTIEDLHNELNKLNTQNPNNPTP